MATIRVQWVDSVTPGVLGTKIYRDDIEIADVANGVQIYDDTTALEATTYKYEVQAYTIDGESTDEVIGVNVENITTASAVVAPTNLVDAGGETDPATEINLTLTLSISGVMTEYRCYIGGVLQQTFVGDVALGTLTGLTPETLYSNITVRAYNGTDESGDSNSINVTTAVAPPIGVGTYTYTGLAGQTIATTYNTSSLVGDFTTVVRLRADAAGFGTDRMVYASLGNAHFYFDLRYLDRWRTRLEGGGVNINYTWALDQTNMNDGLLHNIVLTYSVSGGILTLYQDGVLQGINSGNTYTGQITSNTLSVGYSIFNQNWNGDIQILQLYTEVLDQTAVTDLETDINSHNSGKVLDLNSVKSLTVWTDNISGANGTVDPSITYTP